MDETRWVVHLSNNETVYQNDSETSSWLKLKERCEKEKLKIIKMGVHFRSHYEYPLEDMMEGYFFSKSAGSILNNEETFHFYNIGYLKNNTVYVKTYSVPDLILKQETMRNPEICKHGLIKFI